MAVKRSRAAILPHFGDPFCLAYFFKWFNEVWGSEIDRLYIVSSNIISDEVMAAILQIAEKSPHHVHVTIAMKPMQHGDAITFALEEVTERFVMLVEEDTVIFKKGMVDECFTKLERGDVDAVVSARASCSDAITKGALKKWPDSIPQDFNFRDHGPAFWPNFYFGSTFDLRRTDKDFNAKTWAPGETVEHLDIVAEETLVGDTFVWASIQLRALGLRFAYVPQHHGHPDDPAHAKNHMWVFDGTACWVHHGSLSGWRMLIDQIHHRNHGVDIGEMARRMQWYTTFAWYAGKEYPDLLPELRMKYLEGIHRIMDMYEVSQGMVDQRIEIYDLLFAS